MVNRLFVALVLVTGASCKQAFPDPPGDQDVGFLNLAPPGDALDHCHGVMLAEITAVERACPGDPTCPDGMAPESCLCPKAGGGVVRVRELEWLAGPGPAPDMLMEGYATDRFEKGLRFYGDGQPVRAFVCIWREAAVTPPFSTPVSQACGFGPTEQIPILGISYVVSRDGERIYDLAQLTTTAPFEPDGRNALGEPMWQVMDKQAPRVSAAQYRQWVADSLARVPTRPYEEQSVAAEPDPSTRKSGGRGPFFCEWSTAP